VSSAMKMEGEILTSPVATDPSPRLMLPKMNSFAHFEVLAWPPNMSSASDFKKVLSVNELSLSFSS